ncbi:TBC1 domain family member 17-like [Crotalus adamanteus]|uniref:TBC1 domain family member 17-like n=1 Tax=Crotalus adamanteus TaxID=8729 RepID=A0AAW1B005_CROAD
MELGGCRVAFEKDEVYLHTSAKRHPDQDSLIPGVIRIIEKGSDTLLQWTPVDKSSDTAQIMYTKKDAIGSQAEEEHFDPGYEPDWAVISTVGTRSRVQEETAVSGPKSPVPRGQWAFSLSLSELKSIRKSKPGLGWSYLIFITKEGISIQALHFHRGGTKALLKALCKYVVLATSPKDSRLYLVYTHDSDALSHSFDELQLFDDSSSNLVSRFLQDPYAATFGGFSKVTNFFRGALHQEDGLAHHSHSDSVAANVEEETGFEVITCQAQLGERPSVQRETPVTEQEWEQHLDPDGRVLDPIGLRKRIFAGGLSMSLRKEVWKYLLNYYSWGNTSEENKAQVRRKTDEYFFMKLQWKLVSEEQELRNFLLRGYRSLIERDVSRTDRNNKFYEGNENPGLVLLNDVLMTYCMYNFDLGYVQGMSDLLSPILYITQNEVDAFWCFCGFMELVVLWTELPCPNFHLLVACGILDAERQALMNSGFGFNEILKHINELTMKMSVEDILCRAEAIYRQLVSTPDLPRNVQELLGLSESKSPTSSTDTASSPQPLSPSQVQEMDLTDSISPSQPDSSIEILPAEDASTSQSLSL